LFVYLSSVSFASSPRTAGFKLRYAYAVHKEQTVLQVPTFRNSDS
jgi:hypothetical protein